MDDHSSRLGDHGRYPARMVEMNFYYEDLSTKRPFHDAEQHAVEDAEQFAGIVHSFLNRNPRILKLRTANHDVYFGVGTDPSFIECFNWETGQAKYPKPENSLSDAKPPTFSNEFETATPPTQVLLPFSEVWKIVECLMRHDDLPSQYNWEPSLDWDTENAG